MRIQIETIYYLENPEEGIQKCVTEKELKYADPIKDVFGVASISDLPMMVQYNKKFQESICKKNNISENEITLDTIFRVATKEDLIQLKNQILNEHSDSTEPCAPPFNRIIQLHEGIYEWNDEDTAYIKVR